MKIQILLLFIFSSLWSMANGNVDEEALLRRKAALVAQKVHMKNLNLIGVNPETCKTTDENRLIINQIKRIKSSSLSHCPSVIESIVKPLDAEIAKVNAGVLEFGPLPKTSVPIRPVADEPSYQNAPQEYSSMEDVQKTMVKNFDPEAPIAPTGLTERDIYRIFETYENNQRQYRPSEEDTLFRILSKAYVRNLDKLIEHKRKME